MKYYLVGIKGSGMSALAQILYDLNNEVRGADVNQEIFTQHNFNNKNIIVDSLDNMKFDDYDVIIVGNSFINKFDFKGKTIKNYQEMVSELNDRFFSIAVCGTHGKTTTTNMIKHVLSSLYDISYLVGDGQGKGTINTKYFVYEACEHRNHFLSYHPNIIVCTNIDYDHVEYFKNKRQYKNSFNNFFCQCKDKIILSENIKFKNEKTSFYGFKKGELIVKNAIFTKHGTQFDLYYNNQNYTNLFLPFYGKHMLLDALSCILCCLYLNIELPTIIDLLKTYKNAGRRYCITQIESNVIIDDYGHHPKEIKMTILATKQQFPNKKLVIIYHPDRPKRLTTFLKDFINVFNIAEATYILPFIKMGEEEEKALRLIVNNKNIFMFSLQKLFRYYQDTIFLFTGSKEMKSIIEQLKIFLKN